MIFLERGLFGDSGINWAGLSPSEDRVIVIAAGVVASVTVVVVGVVEVVLEPAVVAFAVKVDGARVFEGE